MSTARSLTYWSTTISLLALIAGCLPNERKVVPSMSAAATPLSVARTTSAQPTPSAVTSANGQMMSGQLDCKSPQTQAAINTCSSLSAKTADNQINPVYQQLKSKLNNSQQEKLLTDAELAWLRFRDINCAFEKSSYEGGSIAPSVYNSCIERMTKQRTQELKGYLNPM